MSYFIDIQNAFADAGNHIELPNNSTIERWATAALQANQRNEAELTIRITDANEVQQLNNEYRGKNKPTNVLSFPFADSLPPGIALDAPLLGDIVICHEVVQSEAAAQGISYADHFAHLVIHGTLHLLGFDHIEESEAVAMETLEAQLLAQFGIANPYAGEAQPNSSGKNTTTTHSRSE